MGVRALNSARRVEEMLMERTTELANAPRGDRTDERILSNEYRMRGGADIDNVL